MSELFLEKVNPLFNGYFYGCYVVFTTVLFIKNSHITTVVFCMSKPPTLGSLEMLFLSLAPGRS
jgi:hypothetical protein